MPIFIYEPDALERLVEIEGPEYRRCAKKEYFGDCALEAFLEKWNTVFRDNEPLRRARPFAIDVKGTGAIYGVGGWNRYIVLNTGEIMLIKFLSYPKFIERAKRAGFRTDTDLILGSR